MRQEFVDGVSLVGVNAKQVGDKVLGYYVTTDVSDTETLTRPFARLLTRVRDVIPPWTQEGVVPSGNLLGQYADTLVVEGCATQAVESD